MADYLGDKGVPVALVVPFDATQSFPASANISRVLNFTQRDYAHMRPGPGFRGTLTNVDLSGDQAIDHLNIDKAPRLHTRVIGEVLPLAGGHTAAPAVAKPAPRNAPARAPVVRGAPRPDTDTGTPVIARPERRELPTNPAPAPAAPVVPQKPSAPRPAPATAVPIPD
jgi:hypothetical protein